MVSSVKKYDLDLAEGTRAFERFCTPHLSPHRVEDHEKLVERAQHQLRNAKRQKVQTSVCNIQTYIIDPENVPKASVLIVHGWTGESAFMGALADFLRRRGYRAILMDMPAHGKSEREQATLFECARAVLDVAEHFGEIDFALGHSAGAFTAITAGEGRYPLPHGYPFKGYGLISMPDAMQEVTRDFGKGLNLSEKAQDIFEGKLGDLSGRPVPEVTGTLLLGNIKKPAAIIHSTDDKQIPYHNAKNMAANIPQTQLITFENLGHRAILYAPPVARAVVAYFDALLQKEHSQEL